MGEGSSAKEIVVRIADPDEIARIAELKARGTVETLGTTPDGARWCLSVGDCDLDYGAEIVPRPQAGPP